MSHRRLRLLALLVILGTVAGSVGAAEFGIPPGPDPTTAPPPGYFLLVGRDTANAQAGDDVAPFFGDPTMTGCSLTPVPVPGDPGDPCGMTFYIEVTGDPRRLTVDLYDPGLAELDPNQQVGPQLDVSYDTGDGTLGTMHFDLRDPTGAVQASQSFNADTQGAGGTNAALVNFANINNAAPGIWTLHAWMEDTGGRDEEVNVFGLSIPAFRVYTYAPVVGHAAGGGALPASHIAFGGEPLRLHPWIHGATPGLERTAPSDPGTPVYGWAAFNFDLDAEPTADPNDNPSFGQPPPDITGITARGAVSPDCQSDPQFCFVPSVDTAYVRERRTGFNESPLQGTDHGIYTFEFAGMDSTWGVTEPQAPPATRNDVNAFALQFQEYSAPVPALDSTDFPRVPEDGLPLVRWYLPMEGPPQAPPTKEWMGIRALGPDMPGQGVTETYTIQWEIHNPTEYDLADLQSALHVNDSTADVSPPLAGTLMSNGPLQAFLDDDPGSTCPNTGGADPKRVVVCGDLTAGATATVSFDIEVTAGSTDTLFLLGDGDLTDGVAMTGGARPTVADYLTPFTTQGVRETMGPLLAPHVFPTPPQCSADVTLDPPAGEPFCAGTGFTLTATGMLTACSGGAEYRWSTTGGELCRDWTAGADSLALPAGACSAPTADTTYLVEIRCDVDTACSASDQRLVTVHPQVLADAGPPELAICPGETVSLGVDDPNQGVLTGQVAGRDSCSELTYQWDPTTDLAPGDGSCGLCPDAGGCWYPEASPTADTTYTVTVTDPATGCTAQDSVLVSVGTDTPPAHVGCSFRVTRRVDDSLGFSWTDSPDPVGEYQVVALEPNGNTSPCAADRPATWPPDLAAMDAAQVVASASPGTEITAWADGARACPRLLLFKVRPTSSCSNTPVDFTPPACN